MTTQLDTYTACGLAEGFIEEQVIEAHQALLYCGDFMTCADPRGYIRKSNVLLDACIDAGMSHDEPSHEDWAAEYVTRALCAGRAAGLPCPPPPGGAKRIEDMSEASYTPRQRKIVKAAEKVCDDAQRHVDAAERALREAKIGLQSAKRELYRIFEMGDML